MSHIKLISKQWPILIVGATVNSVHKDTLEGHFLLLLRSPLVVTDCIGAVAGNFHDKLLIQVLLIHFRGRSGSKGMIGIVTWKTSLMTHVANNITELIDSS